MERSGLYNIYSSHWDVPISSVGNLKLLHMLYALCVGLLELYHFMIYLAWYMDTDICTAQFVCDRNAEVVRVCCAPYSKLRVIAQHL